MKCDYDYCIYNKDFTCLLKAIEIDSLGHCETCIIVTLPEDKLAEYKKGQFQEIMRRYKKEM